MNNINHVHISTSTILKGILWIIFFILLYILKDVIIIFLFAIIIASAITPFANWLDYKKISRLFGVLMLYLFIFGSLIFVLSLENVQQGSPQYFDFVSEIQNILDTFSVYLQQASQSGVSIIVSIFGGVVSFVAIIVISFYLTVMKGGIES